MSIPNELERVIAEFQRNGLWGQIQIDFQRGELVLIRKQITIKPGDENNVHASNRSF